MRLLFLVPIFGLVIIFAALAMPRVVAAQVMINEVMADPAAVSDKSEWVELYNYSDTDIDLRGWSLDGKLITGTTPVTIAKQGYFVITKTLADFTQEFGLLTNVFELGISLTNSGKTLDLIDGKGYKDALTYAAASPSISWERKGIFCADLVKHPSAHSLNIKNAGYQAQCWPQALTISGIEFSKDNAIWTDTLSEIGMTQVYMKVNYSGTATVQSVEWRTWDNKPLTDPANLSYYPAAGVTVIVHTDKGDFTAASKSLTVFPQLVINEFMPNPDGDDSGQEWIELYNPSSAEVSLSDVELRDGTSQMLVFAGDAKISASGYVVATLPTSKLQNCQKPAVCSDEINVYYKGLLIDHVQYDDSRSGQSSSRDGQNNWHLDWAVTPATVNTPAVAIVPTVQISELFPSPVSAKHQQEWIELYNYGDKAVDLTGWKLSDKSSIHTLSNLIISPHQYLVLTEFGISLNNDGDEISLTTNVDSPADRFAYGTAIPGASQMRIWNGSRYDSDVQLTYQPTPALVNVLLSEEAEIAAPAPETAAVACVIPVSAESASADTSDVEMFKAPLTQVQRLPTVQGALANAAPASLTLWPLFLIVLLGCGLFLGTEESVRHQLKKLYLGINYLPVLLVDRFPQLAQWRSRLLGFFQGQ